MSAPSSPSRADVERVSAASTPSEHRDMAPMQLTPRSKVRATLAALDDDPEVPMPSMPHNRDNGSDSPLPKAQETRESKYNKRYPDASGEGDSDDVNCGPKGRLAARLLRQKDFKRGEETGEGVDLGNAYDRVKKQLLLKKKNEEVVHEPSVSVAIGFSEGEVGFSKGEEGSNRLATPRRRRPATFEPDSAQTPHRSRSSSGASSPGLVISPGTRSQPTAIKQAPNSGNSDDDLPSNPLANADLLALVARKRAERQAKQAAEVRKKSEREARTEKLSNSKQVRDGTANTGLFDDVSDDDAVGERKLTQQARPTRKASKRALEEMNRETQRMSRNMQLAHQAKTKKKVTKESLFARFNFRTGADPTVKSGRAIESSITSSSTSGSDAAPQPDNETPPTSPASLGDLSLPGSRKVVDNTFAEPLAGDVDEELPSMEDIMSQPIKRPEKGRNAATEGSADIFPDQGKGKYANIGHHLIRVRVPQGAPWTRSPDADADTDSDLEIIPAATKFDRISDIFDRLPAQRVTEGRSLQTLRALAHLTSPSKQGSKARASLTSAALDVSLQQRARQQAAQERAEKVQELKARGIIVQSAEERERDQAEVEDLLERARREGDEIQKREKDAAKKERRGNGENYGLGDSSDEDEEYQDDELDEADEPGEGISGSEEGDMNEDGEEDEDIDKDSGDEDEVGGVAVAVTEIGIRDQEADMHDDGSDKEEDLPEVNFVRNKRRSKATRVIYDEDDEDSSGSVENTPAMMPEEARNPLVAGLSISNQAPMGLTQAFAATMADTQSQPISDNEMTDGQNQEQDSLLFLPPMPEPDFPMLDRYVDQELIADSQGGKTQEVTQATPIMREIDICYSQSQVRYDSLNDTEALPTGTQYSDIPDPTQDVGFGMSSPIAGRFVSAPPSTQDTVLLTGVPRPDSIVVKRKGRLRRPTEAVLVLSDVDEDDASSEQADNDFEISANVFDVRKNAARKSAPAQDAFDRKKSDAKGMVEEQAEESEDEYAGLGGASDDESAAEEDEEVRQMIDEGEVKVDEREIAAFYA